MPHPATLTASRLALDPDHGTGDRRQALEWQALHRRPDALPDPVEPVRPVRARVTGLALRLRRSLAGAA